MGKIRVQDLAKMMAISNQDLVFKLKSIGVRVEGDDAHIDTDIVAAILQGKKLPHPREVILRDESAPIAPAGRRANTPASAPAARRPAPNPLRPQRPRTLIQKVEPRIQNLPMSERPAGLPLGLPGGAQPLQAMTEAAAAMQTEPLQQEALMSAGAASAQVIEAPPRVVEAAPPPPPSVHSSQPSQTSQTSQQRQSPPRRDAPSGPPQQRRDGPPPRRDAPGQRPSAPPPT